MFSRDATPEEIKSGTEAWNRYNESRRQLPSLRDMANAGGIRGEVRNPGGKGGSSVGTSGGKGGSRPTGSAYEGKPAPSIAQSQQPAQQNELPDYAKPFYEQMQQPTTPTAQAEPTLTPSQLIGVVQSFSGKGGGNPYNQQPMQQSNPYAMGAKGGTGYGYQQPMYQQPMYQQPMYQPQPYMGGKGMGYNSQPSYNPYAAPQGGKGMGYGSQPSYNPYATQSPYVNYNQPSYGGMGGKGGGIGGKGGYYR